MTGWARGILALGAICVGQACQMEQTPADAEFTNTDWRLQTFRGEPFTGAVSLFVTDAGQVSGQAPCNRYSAALMAPAPQFDIGEVAATKRACTDLDSEAAYFDALADATRMEIMGDTLRLSDDQDVLLVFKPDV